MRGRSKVAVALLSTPEFDATTDIDVESLTFGRTGDEKSLVRCQTANFSDWNGDGLDDLWCLFRARRTGFRAGQTQTGRAQRGGTQERASIHSYSHLI